MKRTWMAVAAVLSATAIFATGARADDPPTVVDATSVTYYLELDGLDAARVKDLAALLKREFPKAQIELIDGTLRIQTDGSTFGGMEKVLAEKLPSLSEGMKIEVRKERALEGKTDKRAAKEAHPSLRVKVGDLCEGCADCLASALRQEFPKLRFVPAEGVIEVYGDEDGRAAVEVWVNNLRALTKGENAEVRLAFKGGDPKPRPDLDELRKRLEEALRTGRCDESMKLSLALARAQADAVVKESLGKTRMEIGPEALDALRGRLELVKTRLETVENANERETLEGVRRRLEEAKEQLEKMGDVLARGGGSGRGGAGGRGPQPPMPAVPPAPTPPRPPEFGGFQEHHAFAGRESKDGRGPLAEFRARIQHLTRAAEHLNAAGYEGLAKQAAEAAEQVKRQAAEVVQRLQAAEEARAAAMKKEQNERARVEARVREEAQRAAGLRGPPEAGELRSEELLDLLRALNQQMNAMREEFKAFREQVARDRPAPR
jgi:DNA repair exonuclease SbcCD ATPase subunit